MDFCKFKPYCNYKGYVDRLDPASFTGSKLDAGDAICLFIRRPTHAIPVGILITYVLLTFAWWSLKYAQIFWPQRPQQTDLAVQEKPPTVTGISERDTSQNRLL